MTDTSQQCAMTLTGKGRRCKRSSTPESDYCGQHQYDPQPTEEGRLAILRVLAEPGVFSLPPYEIRDRILGTPTTRDGRTREHKQWIMGSLSLLYAVSDLHEQAFIYEAVPADGMHSWEARITDAGRDFLREAAEVPLHPRR
jgi:hypothetical protein